MPRPLRFLEGELNIEVDPLSGATRISGPQRYVDVDPLSGRTIINGPQGELDIFVDSDSGTTTINGPRGELEIFVDRQTGATIIDGERIDLNVDPETGTRNYNLNLGEDVIDINLDLFDSRSIDINLGDRQINVDIF